tara:strand:+ start:190 stop:450 length:261 start_codon:yes stop_codon:yes gene_type:complete
MKTTSKRWGNSAAVRLPKEILEQAKLSVSNPIRIDVLDGKIVIKSLQTASITQTLPFTEADQLIGLDAYTAHADELAQLTASEVGV